MDVHDSSIEEFEELCPGVPRDTLESTFSTPKRLKVAPQSLDLLPIAKTSLIEDSESLLYFSGSAESDSLMLQLLLVRRAQTATSQIFIL